LYGTINHNDNDGCKEHGKALSYVSKSKFIAESHLYPTIH